MAAKSLRDSLRRLCAEVGWSYAVFWKAIRRGESQVQLVWGDGHCERMAGAPAISGFEAMDLLLKEKVALRNSNAREGLAPEAAVVNRTEDRIDSLVNKLMVHQVHVVGEGLIGQAALTGAHRWILHDNLDECGMVNKALPEMKQQFWAGIQTIAIIPVLPHGVVQLGSTKMVMEDAALIHHVRSLFGQLGCESGIFKPGAFLEDSVLKTLIHNMLGVPVSVSHQGDIPASVNASAFTTDRINHCHLGSQISSPVLQSSCHPMAQPYGETASCGKQTRQTSTSRASHCDFFQPIVHLDHGPSFLLNDPLECEQSKAQLRIRSPDIRSVNNGFSQTPGFIRGSNSMAILSGGKCVEQCGSQAVKFSTEITEDDTTASDSIGAPNVPNKMDSSTDSHIQSVDCRISNTISVNKKFQTMSITDSVKCEDDSFQIADVPFIESDQYCTYFQSLLGTLQSGSSSNSNAMNGDSSHTAVSVENRFCHSEIKNDSKDNDLPEVLKLPLSSQLTGGNDLFDVLRLQHKPSKLHMSEVNAPKSVSACETEQDVKPDVGGLNDDLTGLISQTDPDELLDAIVSKMSPGCRQNLDISCNASASKIGSPSLHAESHPYASGSSSGQLFCNLAGVSSIEVKTEAPAASFGQSTSSMDKSEGCSQRQQGYKSQIGLWVESSQSVASDSMSAGQCKRIDEVVKSSRKRPRPGENPRPRPKDRQMIQDRIKELREIVPNGAKCSIDALLEKTIKHMLFLQSVAKHADKLKEAGEPKISSQEGGLLLKDNFEGGATWAFEVGTQSMTCPIIVEDLNLPRQMLVEMLCKERGIFLEIADQIRGLGLTILKGVMEVHKDKIWARFAVEANKDVTRMEIFLSLVHLLEPTVGSSMLPKGVENICLPHSAFHPSSIPATGFSDCLR